jgi:hypothetical protein
MRVEGACHCSYITYEAEVDPEKVGLCHCTDCQTLTGSAFSTVVFASRDAFRMVGGKPKIYVKTAESGNRRAQAFCPECGTRIYHAPHYRKDAINLKPGTFDDTSFLVPKYEVWKKRKHSWVKVLGEIVSFDDQPG